jgi:hypothetical protein
MGISQICETIRKYFSSSRPPVEQLPRPLLACALMKRPGLSTVVSVGNIVRELNMLGFNTGVMPDGSPNLTAAFAYVITKEIFRALKLDAVVQVAMGPGALDIQVGPTKGTNVNCSNNTSNGVVT